ncbi:MAG TPA: hypothetical protein O0X65_02890, partial [Methanocorpusculum sp.]|nr:hypothetical protein [Methanocorpusculum sp.]
SLIIGVLICFIAWVSASEATNDILSKILSISIPATITLAAITTAGFVMVVSTGKDDLFVQFLLETDLYDGILFLFIEPVIVGIVNIVMSVVILIIASLISLPEWLDAILLGVSVSLFLYTVFGFLNLYDAFHMFGSERFHYRHHKKSGVGSTEKTEDESLITE